MTDLHANPMLATMAARRSVSVTSLAAPGPDAETLDQILTVAARAPDHGGLEPWRFIVIEGEARREASQRLSVLYAAENADAEPERREKMTGVISRVLTYAPVIVIVVSRTDPAARIPAWEQDLSAGAVCMNLLQAATACGFSGCWLTGWPAYSPGARGLFGVGPDEKIAGVVHIGTAAAVPPDRKRPDLAAITTRWTPN